ncbi:MAG: hypothetical protein EAX96_14825 [Candidatus Lokiarchaeota archaeon]|nr:hypothetical protein [Candidatus Lokiarchaeota archaeon]
MFFIFNNHKIEVRLYFFGKEKVLYDGVEVSNETSLLSTKHKFQVEEDGKPVDYEISVVKKLRTLAIINPISYIVKRNGETILSI